MYLEKPGSILNELYKTDEDFVSQEYTLIKKEI